MVCWKIYNQYLCNTEVTLLEDFLEKLTLEILEDLILMLPVAEAYGLELLGNPDCMEYRILMINI